MSKIETSPIGHERMIYMFKPKAIYFEKDIVNYELGKELMEKYKDVPKVEIENHNNIEETEKSK